MSKKVLGLALLAVGIFLVIMGLDAQDSFASEVSELVDDSPSDKSIWLLSLGILSGVAGLGTLAFGRGKVS